MSGVTAVGAASRLIAGALLAAVALACTPDEEPPAATATPLAVAIVVPTATPSPTATPTPTATTTPTATATLRATADPLRAGDSAVAAIFARNPAVVEIVEHVLDGSIEETLYAFARVTARCGFRREGGESGESPYTGCRIPPQSGETFEAIVVVEGLYFLAGEERIRQWFQAFTQDGLPSLDNAWFAEDGDWGPLGDEDTFEEGPRYLLSFRAPPIAAPVPEAMWGDDPVTGLAVTVIPGNPPRFHEIALLSETWSASRLWQSIEKERLFPLPLSSPIR